MPRHLRPEGDRAWRRPWARRGLAGVLAVVGVLLLAAAWLVVRGLLAERAMSAASGELAGLPRSAADLPRAGLDARLAALQRDTARAHRLTGDPVWGLACRLPLVGPTASTVRGLAGTADGLAHRALPPLVRLAVTVQGDGLRGPDGAVDVARVASMARPLAVVTAEVRAAETSVTALPQDGTPAPVRRARGRLLAELGRLQAMLGPARQAVAVAPQLLGAAGPRRYLLVLQNNAESRGTGGLAGTWGVLSVDAGRVRLVRGGSDTDIHDAPTPVAGLGADFEARWHRFGADEEWLQANLTPHFPWAAQVWAGLYERQTGERVDGVVGTDAVSLAELLGVTGPVTMADGTRLTSGGAVPFLLSGAYRQYGVAQRKAALVALVRLVTAGVTSPRVAPRALLHVLGRLAGQGRLRLWSARPGEQAVLAATPLGGVLSTAPGPYAAAVVQNSAGSKLDYYLDRSLDYTAGPCVPGFGRRSRVVVRLRNDAPPSGLSDYELGAALARRRGVTLGHDRLYVSVYAAMGAGFTAATLDGRPVSLESETERGRPVFSLYVDLPMRRTRVLSLDLVEPDGGTAHLPVPQPLVRPEQVRASVAACL